MAVIGLVVPVVLNQLNPFCFLGQVLLSKAMHEMNLEFKCSSHLCILDCIQIYAWLLHPCESMSRCLRRQWLQVGDDGSEPAHTKARSGPMDFWHLPGCWGPLFFSSAFFLTAECGEVCLLWKLWMNVNETIAKLYDICKEWWLF